MDLKRNFYGVGHKGKLNISESKYDDLRQLESAIREAYVTKELKAQMVEAEASRVAEEARERLKTEILKRSVREAEKREEEELREKKSAKISYGIELKNVVESKERKKILAFEIGKKERQVLEEVSRVIEESEEKRKIIKKLEMADKQTRELRIFREIKEINAQKEAEVIERKRQQDLSYIAETDMRMEALKKARKERESARESVVEIVSNSLLESRVKRLELDRVIADIVAAEKLFEEELKLRKEKERIKLAREETAEEFERHKILVEERKLRIAIEEEEFAAEVMRKVLQDKRVERLTIEAKKRKKLEYRNELEAIIRERRNRRDEEIARLEESLRAERKMSEDLRKLVKDRRKRLLLRHVGNVAQYIANEALSLEEREIVAETFDPSKV